YRIFSRLTVRDLIPDEDAVRRLPRRPAGARGGGRALTAGPIEGGLGAPGPWRRGRTFMTGRQARIMALPAPLLALLVAVVALAAGGGPRCTRAASLHGAVGMVGASCRNGAAAPPPTNR